MILENLLAVAGAITTFDNTMLMLAVLHNKGCRQLGDAIIQQNLIELQLTTLITFSAEDKQRFYSATGSFKTFSDGDLGESTRNKHPTSVTFY